MISKNESAKKRQYTLTEWILKENNQDLLLALFFAGSFFLLLSGIYDFYYDLNDDTAMRDILSGIYAGTPSGYNIQMLMPLSWFLALWYRLFPQAPCYGIFLLGCQMLAVFLIGFRITQFCKKTVSKVVSWLLFLLLLTAAMLYQLVFIQYSVTSGMLMATVIFWSGTAPLIESVRKKRGIDEVIVIILSVLAFCMRTEMALMLVPFWGLIVFFQWLTEQKPFSLSAFKRAFLIPAISVLLMLLALGINSVAYGNEDWKTFMRFFDERTELYDFIGIPDYEENQEFYEVLQISESEWKLLENYNFALDEEWNADTFAEVVNYRKQQVGTDSSQPIYCYAGLYTTENMKNAVWLYKNRIFYNQSGVWYDILLTAYIAVFLSALLYKNSLLYAKIGLLFAGRSVIWLYLLVRNRVPERILVPLYLAEIVVLLCFFLEIRKSRTVEKRRLQQFFTGGIAMICVIAGGVYLLSSVAKTNTQYQKREVVNTEWNALQTYCREHGDDFYFLDVYSTVAYSEKMFANVDNTMRNSDLCGGWISKSPVAVEKLSTFQITDVETALAEQDHVYFISRTDRDIDWITAYYAEKGNSIQVMAKDYIGTEQVPDLFTVYTLRKVIDKDNGTD